MDRATLLIKREATIAGALHYEGTVYYSADGSDPAVIVGSDDDPVLGFNCSGFIVELLRRVGLLSHNARPSALGLYAEFHGKEVKGSPQRGDLIFFGKIEPGKEPAIGHVAIMVDDLHFMEAGGGSRGTDTLAEAAKRNAFVRMRPVEFRENERVAVCRIWE